MRVAPAITLIDAEREQLTSITRSRTKPLRLVQRANIVLLAERGLENLEIAERLQVSLPLVGRWRRRYAAKKFAGIENDAPRSGRPPTVSAEVVETIVNRTTQETPPGQTHWSQHSMSKATGVSPSTVCRIWRSHGLKPHLVKTFKVSNDPLFAEKLQDIVGLYINPPEHAVVLCADEKCQIQALDRTQPGLPLKRGRAGTATHDYNAMARRRFSRRTTRSMDQSSAPVPFIWTATSCDILEKVKRARQVLKLNPASAHKNQDLR